MLLNATKKRRGNSGNIFFCKKCDVECSNKYNYDRHLESVSHATKNEENEEDTEEFFYFCKKCDYSCSNKKNFERHLATRKHKCYINATKNEENEEEEEEILRCGLCHKTFKHASSMYRHKKTCTTKHPVEKETEIECLTNLVLEVVRQNNEFQKNVFDMMQSSQTITTQNIHNTNTQNSYNKFNLNFFLNETCKDAMNISEFVEYVKISMEDIEKVGSLGYVEGISNIILQNLRQLDVCKRPIHCTDAKREVIHVKDTNAWQRESEEKPVLTDAIKHIAHKNVLMIRDWKQANPDYRDSECKKNDVYMRIVHESMGACDKVEDQKNYQKIILKIACETALNDKVTP